MLFNLQVLFNTRKVYEFKSAVPYIDVKPTNSSTPATPKASQVRRRPLGDGERDGGRGWSTGLRYIHSLSET